MTIPKNLKYAKTHEWVRVEGDSAVVGISDHAQRELSDVVYIELPSSGSQLTAGKECAVVESVKAASDIYAPLTGEVTAINESLSQSPELLNQDPHDRGWLYKVKFADKRELDHLLTPEEYASHIGEKFSN